MKRRSSAVDLVFYSAIFLFVFSIALLINFSVNRYLIGLQRSLISKAEQALDLRLGYRKIYFKSLNTLTIEGVHARSSHFKEDDLLFACDKLQVSFNLLGLLFSGDSVEKNIRVVKLHRPVFNLYGGKASTPAEKSESTVLVTPPGGDPMTQKKLAALFSLLKVKIVKGKVRYFASRGNAAQSPNFELRIKKGSVVLEKGIADFKIDSILSMMPSGRMFVATAGIVGQYNLLKDDANLLFTMENNSLAGIYMPDLRFFITYNNGLFAIDSSLFKQVVQINGKYTPGSGGSFTLDLTKDSRFFMDFINKNITTDLDGMFFHPDGGYRPSGKVQLNLGPGWMLLRGRFSVVDRHNQPVLSLLCRGAGDHLRIDRFFMQRGLRRIALTGVWRFSNMLPDLSGSLRNVKISGEALSGNFRLSHLGNDRYKVDLNGVSLNGSLLGAFSTFVAFDSEGVNFNSKGLNRLVNLRGYIDKRGDIGLRFTLNGLNVGTLAKAIRSGPAWFDRELRGNLDFSIVDNIAASEGNIRIINKKKHDDYYALEYSYDGESLRVKNLSAPALGVKLQGSVRFGVDVFLVKLGMLYYGKRYAVDGMYRTGVQQSFLTLNVGRSLTLHGRLGKGEDLFQGRLQNFSLRALGVDAQTTGFVTLRNGKNGLYVNGKLDCFGAVLPTQFVKKVSVLFSGTDKRMFLQRVVLKNGERSLVGKGELRFDATGLHAGLNFGKQLAAMATLKSERLQAKVEFRDFDLNSVTTNLIKGKIRGYIAARGNIERPQVEAALTLARGSLYGTPLAFSINTVSAPSGFMFKKGKLRYGSLSTDIRSGYLQFADSGHATLSLKANLGYAASIVKLKGHLALSGVLGGGGIDLFVGLTGLQANGQKLAPAASRVQYRDGMLQLLRRGATGVTGFYNLKKQAFSLKAFENNLLALNMTGRIGSKTIDFYMTSPNLRLGYLNYFPGLFKKATGLGKMELSIQGDKANPRVSGTVVFEKGSFEAMFFGKPVKNFAVKLRFNGERVLVEKISGKIGKGTFLLAGSCFLRKGGLEDLNLRFRTDRKEGIVINLDDEELKSKGLVFADLFIKGNPNSPSVSGRLALKDNNFSYMDYGGKSSDDNFIKRINWHMDVNVLDGVRYSHTLVNAVVKPGSGIRLRNRIRDKNFLVLGKVEVVRGNFDYINHDFVIEQPTYLEFKKVGGGFDAWLTFIGRLSMKIENEENVTIYMTYSGYIKNGIKPRFHSDPSKKESEILALLGVENKKDETIAKNQQDNLLRYTDILSSLGLKVFVSKNIKQFLGLDLFSIRTPLVRNILERDSLDAMDPKRQLSIWRDTQFSLGKYLTSFMFIEYTLTLKDDEEIIGELIPTHQFGLELSFKSLNFGYLIKPTEKSRYKDYEHNVRIRFRHRF